MFCQKQAKQQVATLAKESLMQADLASKSKPSI
jgi:hypothetical protein